MRSVAYLSCELKGRDFDSRLLIAAHLLSQGVGVVFGQQWWFWRNHDALPKGCVLMTAGSQVHAINARDFKDRGHRVLMSDEEALALISPSHLVANIVPDAIAAADVFLAQSQEHAKILWHAYPAHLDKVLVTGSPRCDLLTPMAAPAYREAVEAIRSEGPYILFNSNFALAHYLWGDIDTIDPERLRQHGIRIDMLPWERENLRQFEGVLEWCISTMPHHRIIIRPHPAEHPDAWKKWTNRSSRVRVVRGSQPVEWILGASLVVHCNCTTGLEAAMAGIPALNLTHDPEAEWHKAFITPRVNSNAMSVEEAGQIIPTVMAGGVGDVSQVIEAHLPQWKEATAAWWTADTIMRESRELPPVDPAVFAPSPRWNIGTPHAAQTAKFTAGRDEIEERVGVLARAFGLPLKIGTRELADSVLLMVPQ